MFPFGFGGLFKSCNNVRSFENEDAAYDCGNSRIKIFLADFHSTDHHDDDSDGFRGIHGEPLTAIEPACVSGIDRKKHEAAKEKINLVTDVPDM